MCGTGRFLIQLLQAGYPIEGFDASEAMLATLHHNWAQISQTQAPVWHQFLQDFTSTKSYNLIFIPYGSWGLITNLDDAQIGLNRLYAHLNPGGTLIVEIETTASLPEYLDTPIHGSVTKPDGSKITLNALSSYSAVTQLFTSRCRYDLIVNNQIVESEYEDFKQYLYRFDEFDEQLIAAGFVNIQKYQDYALTAATNPTHTIMYVCTKA